jgi:hypothetical protein
MQGGRRRQDKRHRVAFIDDEVATGSGISHALKDPIGALSKSVIRFGCLLHKRQTGGH